MNTMKDKKQKIASVLLITLGALVFLSLIYFNRNEPIPVRANAVQHRMGFVGFWMAHFLIRKTIGYAAFVFPLLMIAWGMNSFRKTPYKPLPKISWYTLLFALYFSVATALIGLPREIAPDQVLAICSQEPWGLIGGLIKVFFSSYFGTIGGIIIFLAAVISTVVSLVNIDLSGLFSAFHNAYQSLHQLIFRTPAMEKPATGVRINRRNPLADYDEEEVEKKKIDTGIDEELEPDKFEEPDEEGEEEAVMEETEDGDREMLRRSPSPAKAYVFPPFSLLDSPAEGDDEVGWDEFMVSAKTLEEKLADFGIQGKVVEINPGPVITRYEIEPAPGVKVNRFTSLADDLALVMRAKRIRVVAPIPGKAAIGIEIPNRRPNIVSFKEIIESPQFQNSKLRLPLALGKTIAGDVYITDLVSMPHLLIAGATGSGKSVCLHSIIASILFKARPDQVQIAMIDPKRLELSPYSALKNHHVVYREDIKEAVVTTAANAVQMLRSLEREMEKRYELLAHAGVRHIDDYNASLKNAQWENAEMAKTAEKLPYIVLIIDELADLMLIAAREVEEPIARLTQMSRAVGIHLIVATQRPSVDVITGVIKANFPSRMAFQVATKTDSRTILDINGAEKLLGKGDMLFIPPGSPEPIRIHNAFISPEEVKRIIEHIRQQPVPKIKTRLITEEEMTNSNDRGMFKNERDELFDEALKLVVRHQQGSSSLLQRRLKIGYTRAARIIDQLEEAGYVGPFDGSKAREVLVSEEDIKDLGIA